MVRIWKWTIRTTAKVRADSHSVVAWFEHPDRIEESFAELLKRGLTDCSVDYSSTDSIRVRDVRYKTPRRVLVHIRVESDLGPGGQIGTWTGDRFLLVRHGSKEDRSARGAQLAINEWDETMEFIPTGDGVTEIIHTQHQRFMGPHWYERLLRPTIERTVRSRKLRGLALRCEQAQRTA